MDSNFIKKLLDLSIEGIDDSDIEFVLDILTGLQLNEAEVGEKFIIAAGMQIAACIYSIRMEEVAVKDNLPSPGFFKALSHLDQLIEWAKSKEDE